MKNTSLKLEEFVLQQENKLGIMPIGALLVRMSIPMMISFFIQALYNTVDAMFVAKISEDALTAVSIAFPVQQLMTAIAVGTGVAVNALVPRYQGQGQPERGVKIANVAVFLSFCYCIIFLVVGLFFVRPYYALQTDVSTIVESGVDYLTIVCTVCMGAFFGQNFEKLLVATGNSFCSMAAQATGAIFNIIFDPLLIFGLGPFPALGVSGAAWATVLGQILAAIVALVLLHIKEKQVRLNLRHCLPSGPILKEIYSIAVPSILTVGSTSIMSFLMNQIFLGFSTTATALYGIWMKLQNFAFMPCFGMNNGTIPIISYNYGAGKKDRVRQVISLALRLAVCYMVVLAVVFELIPGLLLHLFSASENMMDMGAVALRICSLSMPFGAASLILASSYQSLGRSSYTLTINLCRQLIFVVPLAWLLSLSGNLNLVWLSVVLSEALALVVAIFLWRKIKTRIA